MIGSFFNRANFNRAAPGPKKVSFGELEISEMGIGTWSWGNQLLWGYEESMDPEIQEVFDLCVSRGVTFFDTGDSYGTGVLYQVIEYTIKCTQYIHYHVE
jgi:aryl-alcohol dehydrogenase-like predicted oxidoreductase